MKGGANRRLNYCSCSSVRKQPQAGSRSLPGSTLLQSVCISLSGWTTAHAPSFTFPGSQFPRVRLPNAGQLLFHLQESDSFHSNSLPSASELLPILQSPATHDTSSLKPPRQTTSSQQACVFIPCIVPRKGQPWALWAIQYDTGGAEARELGL